MKEYILSVKYQETMAYFDSHALPELVRCKDCKKHYNELKCRCGGYTPNDWFCAGGVPKEGVTDVR